MQITPFEFVKHFSSTYVQFFMLQSRRKFLKSAEKNTNFIKKFSNTAQRQGIKKKRNLFNFYEFFFPCNATNWTSELFLQSEFNFSCIIEFWNAISIDWNFFHPMTLFSRSHLHWFDWFFEVFELISNFVCVTFLEWNQKIHLKSEKTCWRIKLLPFIKFPCFVSAWLGQSQKQNFLPPFTIIKLHFIKCFTRYNIFFFHTLK